MHFFISAFLDVPYKQISYQFNPQTLFQRLTFLNNEHDFKYSLDGVDCLTYVEMVLALWQASGAENFSEFQKVFEESLASVQYYNGIKSFFSRNHFMSKDWIPNNSTKVEDFTTQLPYSWQMAEAIITPTSWLKKHNVLEDIEINDLTLDDFKKENQLFFEEQTAQVPYIPIETVISRHDKITKELPEICIVTIVRPNWALKDKIGTNLNISHLGFLVKDENQLYFFHANIDNKVVKVLFSDYLLDCLKIETIRGFNFLKIKEFKHS